MSTITFGKHKGKVWKTIARTDTGYFEWALTKLDTQAYEGPDKSDLEVYLANVKDSRRANALVDSYLAKTSAKQSNISYSTNPYTPTSTSTTNASGNLIAEFEATMLDSFGMFPIKRGYVYGSRYSSD